MTTNKAKPKTRKSAVEAAVLSPHYVAQELKKVRWAKWKTVGNKPGTARNFGDVLGFMAVMTALSAAISAGISWIASFM